MNDTLTDGKIIEFKQKLDERILIGFKNWLVIYAGYTTPTEQIRFKNQNWIFWDLNKDDRYSIKGSFNEENLMKLDGILSNTFDYICFDDNVEYYYKDNNEKLIYRLLKILKPGGVLVIKNIIKVDDINEDDFSKLFFLSKKNMSTPHGIGYGGDTLLDKIFKIVEYIKYQKIKTVNLSDYNNIWRLISSLNERFTTEISNCKHTLKMIIKNISKKISPEYCKEFLEKYREINQYCDSNEENLNKEYQELLGKLAELWSLPNYSYSIEDSNISELFFIKKADYPLEAYS